MDSPHNPVLKAIFVFGTALVLAVYLGMMIGSEDYMPLIYGAMAVIGCSFWFFSGRFFWVFTVASSFLAGTFPILRGQFTPFQILMAMGLIRFLFEDVVIRRARIRLPSRWDMWMIIGFMTVLTIHAVNDRFGMRFLGSTVWGGRHYVNVYVGLAAFFVIQSLPMNNRIWGKVPYVILAVTGFDLFIALLTTAAPGLIYVIYPFYSAVAMTSLQEAIGTQVDPTGRIGAFGNFGFILCAIIFATVSLRALFHPTNFFRLFGVLLGSLGVLASGFRSAVLNTFLLTITAGIRDLKAAALMLIPAIAALFFVLSVVNSEIVTLPKQIQRGLAFLPGHWDSDMVRDAQASNDFRFQVCQLWSHSYFPVHPIIGRGFGFEAQWTKRSIYYGEATDYRQIVETGNIHNGFIATIDTLGILGGIFFIAWNISLLVRALKVPFDGRGGEYMALRFIALYLAVAIASYWIGSASVGTFLPQEFALAGLFLRLQRDLKPAERPRRLPASPEIPAYAAIAERNRLAGAVKQRGAPLAFRRNSPGRAEA